MVFFNSIKEWKKKKYEEKLAQAQLQGTCPECQGTGINFPLALMEYVYTNINDCPGCNGSGSYADWAAMHSTTE